MRRAATCALKPAEPPPTPRNLQGAKVRARGWGLRRRRPLPRTGSSRKSRRRGRPAALRTSAGLGFHNREEEREEEERGGEKEEEGRERLCVSVGPPSAPGLVASPHPLERGDLRGLGRRL